MSDDTGFQLALSAAERYEQVLYTVMAPFVAALIDETAIDTDDWVLDVACGTGFGARAAAGRVGPSGRVAAVDVNPAMLAVARRSAATAAGATGATVVPGSPNVGVTIEWHQATADDLPFPDAVFDAAMCQQGLQFFPDMQAAVDELARVTREGGRIAVTVWLPLERSPYMRAQFLAIQEVLGDEGGASFAAAFACDADMITQAFQKAGLRDVEAREVVADVRLPSVAEFVPAHLAALPWGAALAEARPDGVEVASASILRRLASGVEPDGSLTASFGSLLVAGTR